MNDLKLNRDQILDLIDSYKLEYQKELAREQKLRADYQEMVNAAYKKLLEQATQAVTSTLLPPIKGPGGVS